jgi:hypothetical protein
MPINFVRPAAVNETNLNTVPIQYGFNNVNYHLNNNGQPSSSSSSSD